ncbi:hypothetical protein [Candidatus Lokiarchaeum ossiferum]|uniref:hypothetical protein n=1 Tax=Candidatus Lokiarchaeum ossiferum TaxID=2951803 RepID=UPI00352FE248
MNCTHSKNDTCFLPSEVILEAINTDFNKVTRCALCNEPILNPLAKIIKNNENKLDQRINDVKKKIPQTMYLLFQDLLGCS